MKHNPQTWLDKAKGYKEAYKLVFDEYGSFVRRGLLTKEIILLIHPQNHLFAHSIELYLKAFLAHKGENDLHGHDLSKLRERCSKYDIFFDNDRIKKHIDNYAGSKKNFADIKYPDRSSSSSFSDLVILEEISNRIALEIENFM